ncbi:MAG: DUF4294 domain-containing protein [Bacteroidota bacterium]
MKTLWLIWCSILVVYSTSAQTATDTTKADSTRKYVMVKQGYEVHEGDTISVYLLRKFNVQLDGPTTEAEKKAFRKLVYDIKKVLPYAKLAAFRLQMMEDNLNLMSSEKEKKKYIKACEKSIKDQFMGDLKNFEISQGKLLLKLIHRETGKSTWDIMSNYRGGLETLFWQAMAKTYNADMKDTYDPVVDYQIEEIIKSLEIENAN